jgi:predicted transcriptional regulator
MPLQLPPGLASTVQEFLATGHYKNEEEVLQEALSALHQREDDLAAITEGIEDEAAGKMRPWEEVKAELDAKYGFIDQLDM